MSGNFTRSYKNEPVEKKKEKKRFERKVHKEPQNEPVENKKSQDNVSVNTENQHKSLIGDSSDVPSKKSACPKQLEFINKDKNNNQDVSDNRNIEELMTENKKVKKNLEHSRMRCRELRKTLREERERKRIKIEDFNMIRTLLNRYI